MRPCIELSNGLVSLSPFRYWLGCIINTSGRDFRKGQQTKASSVPPYERLRLNDCENLQDRWKPPIQLDQEPAVVIREPNPARHLPAQSDQLMA
jgi:hypothetical protein